MDLNIDTLLYSIYSTILNPLLCVILTLTLAARSPHWNTTSLQIAVSYSTAVVSVRILQVLDARGYFLPGRHQNVSRKLDWSREVVLITGGAGGLGGLIAEIYAIRGVSVAVVDILDETSKRVDEWDAKGGAYYRCDVGDAEAVQALKDRVHADVRSDSPSCPNLSP
jgi:NADPH:quinone reductase-like Zn-dependent oxidoreductase